jgi:hypothetical protein
MIVELVLRTATAQMSITRWRRHEQNRVFPPPRHLLNDACSVSNAASHDAARQLGVRNLRQIGLCKMMVAQNSVRLGFAFVLRGLERIDFAGRARRPSFVRKNQYKRRRNERAQGTQSADGLHRLPIPGTAIS